MYKNPAQVSRERTGLFQYDWEDFEIPRFQKLSTLCDQSTEKVKYGKVKRKGILAYGQIQKRKNEDYRI